jgi:hypothetical protein
MNLRSGILLPLTLLFLGSTSLFAQQSREVFGKNRIQYRQFDWVYLSGENFDVYYYDARKTMATEALEFLEGEFDRITDLIGYPPYFKTKVFIYNSLSDLRQSNVGLNHNVFNVGGETEFIKPYVEVAHLGTAQEFKDELLYQISDLMINEMMFGGNLKDMFQSSILMNLPEWFVEGASRYVAKGWSIDMDDYIRQLMATRKARRATKLGGKDAELVGQSIWNFIAEKYGKSSVANILNYTRVTRNEEKSILITLGINFRQLLAEWQKFYTDMSVQVGKSYINPADSNSFTHQHNWTTEFTTVKVSPDGRNIAYAENDRGRYIIKVRSLETGKEKRILSGGSKVIKQRVDYRLPLIAWADANTLGVIGVKNGEYIFWMYDFNTKTKIPRELERFSNIRSFDFSGNGRLVILSADFEGRSDLFLLSAKRDRVRRLTNDMYDDLDPSFIPNTNRIVFSSNRTTDTLRANAKPQFEQLSNNYNLFIYDLDSTKFLDPATGRPRGRERLRKSPICGRIGPPLTSDTGNLFAGTAMNRRYFLMSTAVMAGSAAVKGLAQSPNETVRVAVIGLGGRGTSHVNAWSRMKNVEVAAICDVDESHIGEKFKLLEGRGARKPTTHVDIRKLLESKDIDAVSVATPNHWHTS